MYKLKQELYNVQSMLNKSVHVAPQKRQPMGTSGFKLILREVKQRCENSNNCKATKTSSHQSFSKAVI